MTLNPYPNTQPLYSCAPVLPDCKDTNIFNFTKFLFLKKLKVFIDLYPSVDDISLIVSASLKALLRYRITLVFQWGKSRTFIQHNPNLCNIMFTFNSYLILSHWPSERIILWGFGRKRWQVKEAEGLGCLRVGELEGSRVGELYGRVRIGQGQGLQNSTFYIWYILNFYRSLPRSLVSYYVMFY